MNFRLVFKLTGKTLLVEAGALLLPLLVCLFYRENPLPFLLSIAMTGAVGLALSLIPSNDHFFPREGFFAVAPISETAFIIDNQQFHSRARKKCVSPKVNGFE